MSLDLLTSEVLVPDGQSVEHPKSDTSGTNSKAFLWSSLIE